MTSLDRRRPRPAGSAIAAPLAQQPAVAAVLSFLLPGLGQAAAGAYRRGLVFMLPAIAVVGLALSIGARGFERGFLTPDFLTNLWWVNLVAFAYHVVAVVDAYLVARRRMPDAPLQMRSVRETAGLPGALLRPPMPRRRRQSPAWTGLTVLAAVVVATVGIHGYVAAVDMKEQQALSTVFNPVPPWSDGSGSTSSDAPGTPSPTATPNRQWAADGKLNVLLVGIDRGPGGQRDQGLRPDSMILLHVDLKSGKAAMFGIPRNFVNVPLPPEVASHYPCGCWPDLLDYFWQEAADTHPGWYKAAYGNDRWVRGIKALEGAVGQLTGVTMDGAFLIDLKGFIKLIDSIGGIDITVPKELRDTQYPKLEQGGTMTIDIKAGFQHMNGTVALEYARSRKSTSDYDRMRRQQLVLRAVRDQVAHPCAMIPKVPDILDSINNTFWTDLPINAAPDLLALAERVGTADTKSYTLVPASFADAGSDVTIPEYLDASSIAKVRQLVANSDNPAPATSPSPGASASPGVSPTPASSHSSSGGGFSFGC